MLFSILKSSASTVVAVSLARLALMMAVADNSIVHTIKNFCDLE